MISIHSAAEGKAQDEAVTQGAGSNQRDQPVGRPGCSGELTDEQLESILGGNAYGSIVAADGGPLK